MLTKREVCVGFGVGYIAATFLINSSVAIEPSPEWVTLNFPNDRMMGFILISTEKQLLSEVPIETVPEARGSIRVRRDEYVSMAFYDARAEDASSFGVDLSYLRPLGPRQLHDLYIYMSRVTADSLPELVRHRGLKRFAIGGLASFDDAALAPIENLASLEILDLSQEGVGASFVGKVTDETLRRIGKLPRLKSLRIVPGDFTDGGIVQIGGLIGLEELDLRKTRVTDRAFDSISGFRKLRKLVLSSENVKGIGLSKLVDLLRLCELSLSSVQLEDATIEGVARLQQVRNLSLIGSRLSDDALRHIGRLTELKSLNMQKSRIDGSGLVQLRNLTQLKHLNLSDTNLDDQALDALEAFTNLEHLELDGTRITDAAIAKLKKLNSLRYAYLSASGVSKAGADELREALPGIYVLAIQRAPHPK